MSEKTSIQVSKDTKDRLDKLGIKGDTFDDIICRLLEQGKRRKRVLKD